MDHDIPHLKSATREGVHTVDAVDPDGTAVRKTIDTSAAAARRRLSVRSISDAEFERHFGDLPTGPA